ncbi:hypothetical protein O0L34_g11891 [Tuta absoluta]|nr:hypothetical protein O0L34_g11891 [Tuta absoluta]
MQGALIKKKLEEQRENYRRRHEMHAPKQATPISFTPTSVSETALPAVHHARSSHQEEAGGAEGELPPQTRDAPKQATPISFTPTSVSETALPAVHHARSSHQEEAGGAEGELPPQTRDARAQAGHAHLLHSYLGE